MKITSALKFATFGIVFMITWASCSKNPKVITPDSADTNSSTGIFSDETTAPVTTESLSQSNTEELHTVTILEVLPTTKYVYLRVKEGQEEFWIATLKTEVSVGETYFYRGGLLKTNFESQEHQRVFETMYLVSSIVKADHGTQAAPMPQAVNISETKLMEVKGSVKIAELVAHPEKYDGKTIQISGKCVKVNPNIMGRNWVHLQDGSQDDYDLVITCDVQIPVGHTVTMRGKVVRNKDFGSGYQYAILLEDGDLVRQ